MEEKYHPAKIERKWQRFWEERKTFEANIDETREKFYCLEMLPYPSGRLHMGHVRNYSIGDALAWYKRLKNYNVLHPIGWDSFGQPAEQAAINRGVNPREWTEENIAYMTGQLKRLGISYDWRRQMFAHRPDYYKWDQWFFVKMYERGLVYKKTSPVNWCPREETVLSNEQSSGGVCWRCGAHVVKKDLEQWFVRTTDYAQQLLDDMREIEAGWPEDVLKRQRDWIGRSDGAFVDFAVEGVTEKIRVFTTRIDTIFGATFVVVAPEHPVLKYVPASHRAQVDAFVCEIQNEKNAGNANIERGEEEKRGIATGLFATNPFSGERVPVWTANYVLMEYGTGAVMAVPAHDERDFEFAKKYDLPIRQVIVESHKSEVGSRKSSEESEVSRNSESRIQHPELNRQSEISNPQSKALRLGTSDLGLSHPQFEEGAFVDYGVLINSGEWSGETSEVARREMAKYAEANGFGKAAVTYRLRDWGISRQRFWGAPIPIVYCEKCGAVPVPEKDLPVRLPASAPFTGTGESPLAKVPEFVNTVCPKCGGAARRETDTMDTFVDSSWYFFRYCDPHNTDAPFDKRIAAYWTPVDQYIGGDEHAVMHLIYTRFWTKWMRDIGLIAFDEPVKRLLTQGMVVAETFYRDEGERRVFFNPSDVEIERDAKGRITSARLTSDGLPVSIGDIEKMSKSKNNGVDPDEMIEAYGADAVRLFILFAAPPENDLLWRETGIDGTLRFLRRVYSMLYQVRGDLQRAPKHAPPAEDFEANAKRLRHETHRAIQRVTNDFERLQFNTSVAALMELSNALSDFTNAPHEPTHANLFAVREAFESLTLMLAPFAPHTAEELWEALGYENGILGSGAQFPVADETLARREELEIPVQINGKLRGKFQIAADASEDEMRAAALADEKIQSHLEDKQIVKIIVVPQRLVNIVVR
jgi:leucyl-tRNA synthetase